MQKHYICTTDFNITMATVKAFIRSGKKDTFANIRFRLSDGRNIQLFHTSELLVKPSMWDAPYVDFPPRPLLYIPIQIVCIHCIVHKNTSCHWCYMYMQDASNYELTGKLVKKCYQIPVALGKV